MIEVGKESVQLVDELLCLFGVDTLCNWFASGHRLQVFPELFRNVGCEAVFSLVLELSLVLGYLSSNLSLQILRLLHVSLPERLLSLREEGGDVLGYPGLVIRIYFDVLNWN